MERQQWEDQDVPDSIPEKKVDPTGFSIGESLGTDDPLLHWFQLQGDEGDTDPSTWVMGGWDEPDIIPLSEDEGEEQTWGDRNAAYWARVRAKNEKIWLQKGRRAYDAAGDSKSKLRDRIRAAMDTPFERAGPPIEGDPFGPGPFGLDDDSTPWKTRLRL